MAQSLRKKTVAGLIWSGLERFSYQGIQFLVQMILMTILLPEDFGTIGILIVFVQISYVLVDSGFSNALIRKYNPTETDYSTSFYFNLVVGVCLYLIFFFAAPFIANFYDNPELKPLMRFVSLLTIFDSLSVVQRAKFTISLDFKTQARATITASLLAGVVAIVMTYKGFGVWALATQIVLNNFIATTLFWLYSKWIPKKPFSWRSFRELFGYGSKILASGLIDSVYRNIATLIIGKQFQERELGFYSGALQITRFPSQNLTGILQRVSFPMLSSIQNEEERLAVTYRKLLRLSAFVVFPLMFGLSTLISPIILSIFSEKWEGVIPYVQILCFSSMWYPIHAINLNLLQVKGRSDIILKLEIIKKSVGLFILLITIFISVKAICIGYVVNAMFSLVINTYYTGKFINVGLFTQLKDLLPTLVSSFLMAVVVLVVIHFIPNLFLKWIVGAIIGVVFYFGIRYLTNSPDLEEVLKLAKIKK